jgi:hypothetical protein
MNAHVRDNLNAVRTAQKISHTTKTSNTTFNTSTTTVTSFSHTFDSGTTYEILASVPSFTPASAAVYTFDITITVNAVQKGQWRVVTDTSGVAQQGGTFVTLVSGVSGSLTVALAAIASTGTGHSVNGGSTTPVYFRIRPLDVV